MTVITKTGDLEKICERFKSAPYVTVDTEFLRDNTFWPILCLIQLGIPGEAYAIDPLANGLKLDSFYELMAAPDVVKVFHAARQDIEIFVHEADMVPHPLFDTQIAAMVCGFGDSAGYEMLVNSLAGANLDKSARFTDWSHRPLTDRQITYALGDVTHLCVVYEKLSARMEKNGRLGWLAEEMSILSNPDTYRSDPEDAWKRLKTRNRNKRFLALTRELAAWREREAQSRNIPRNRVMKDETIMELAGSRAASLDALGRVRGMTRRYSTEPHGLELLKVIDKVQKLPESDLPPAPPQPSRVNVGPEIELLKLLLKMISQQQDVASKLVANASDLEDIATGNHDNVAALKGWRYELFGREALAVLAGNLGFTVRKGKLVTIPVEAD